ncbi:MAG: hypothetical protein GYA17_02480 [Chloroflexi bacterium]|nr:hypothetical protein [Chloroflexota bacterium]
MLDQMDLSVAISKDEYNDKISSLKDQLTLLHRAGWEAKIPILVLFEGWELTGKGEVINQLARTMDPRGFKIYSFTDGRGAGLPWLWPYWMKLPAYGQLAIYDGSWYGRLYQTREEKIHRYQWEKYCQDIVDLERTLKQDGYVLVKFFFHLQKSEQKQRILDLQDDPVMGWRVTPQVLAEQENFKEHLKAAENLLSYTETEWAPWTIVEATDRNWARLKVFKSLCNAMEQALLRQRPNGADVVKKIEEAIAG